ncbi:hypothetical protein MKX03_030687 [Papaver bracteatum]|nr:hypothetical protein MKX03_030687 [Papaver bracteatum]
MSTSTRRLLSGVAAAAPPPEPLATDSDLVIILAALLCALICVVGLFAVARCAWSRRNHSTTLVPQLLPAANKGLKKKIIQQLPKINFSKGSAIGGNLADCAICLTEFVDGDEIRVLPQCGHGFHVGCIDTWLGSHSSCPSCRQIFISPTPRCQKCGGVPARSDETCADLEVGLKSSDTTVTQTQEHRFLP